MENEKFICPIQNEEFMFSTTKDGIYYSEYEKQDGEIINKSIFDLIEIEDKEQFGLIGKGIFIFYNKYGIFDVTDKKFRMELIKDGKNILEMERIEGVIAYKDAKQFLEDNALKNELYRYNLGYKIENESVFARIILQIDKNEGLSFSVDVTSKDDFNGNYKLYLNDEVIAESIVTFEKNKKNIINIKL